MLWVSATNIRRLGLSTPQRQSCAVRSLRLTHQTRWCFRFLYYDCWNFLVKSRERERESGFVACWWHLLDVECSLEPTGTNDKDILARVDQNCRIKTTPGKAEVSGRMSRISIIAVVNKQTCLLCSLTSARGFTWEHKALPKGRTWFDSFGAFDVGWYDWGKVLHCSSSSTHLHHLRILCWQGVCFLRTFIRSDKQKLSGLP